MIKITDVSEETRDLMIEALSDINNGICIFMYEKNIVCTNFKTCKDCLEENIVWVEKG